MTGLAGADLDGIFHGGEEDLAVAQVAGVEGLLGRLHHDLRRDAGDHHGDFHRGPQGHGDGNAAVHAVAAALGTAAQTAGVQAAISVSYIWVETVCYIIGAAILILFWTVEKDLPREQAEIAKRNKK